MLVSHLLPFSYIDADEDVGTPFQAISIDNTVKKNRASMTSLKDAYKLWRMVNLLDGVKLFNLLKTKTEMV